MGYTQQNTLNLIATFFKLNSETLKVNSVSLFHQFEPCLKIRLKNNLENNRDLAAQMGDALHTVGSLTVFFLASQS